MISVCTLVRDTPDIEYLLHLIKKRMPCDYEIVIGDNSVDPTYSEKIKEIADEYIYITDKQFFRMGIPWCHNLVNSIANTYKIFWVDSDEYPIWVHPDIWDMLDVSYVLPVLRADFLNKPEIEFLDRKGYDYGEIMNYLDRMKNAGQLEGMSIQERIYNSRYAYFEGLCHSIFHVPDHFRSKETGAIYLHNRSVRVAKDKDRMDKLIDEQFARQNINPALASSQNVLGWGRGVKHKFEDWKEFVKAYEV